MISLRYAMLGLATVIGTAGLSAPAHAQVFDPGVLTGTLSQDAVTQAEEKRSGTGRYATSQPRRHAQRADRAARQERRARREARRAARGYPRD